MVEDKLINDVVPGTNPKSVGEQDAISPSTVHNNYISPWDINNRQIVKYYHESFMSYDNIYIRITPYIGLAYFDGLNNGTFTTTTANFNLQNGNYPNLTRGNKEYGNYITANPIVLYVNNESTHELAVFSDYINLNLNHHCPVQSQVYQYAFNGQLPPIYFNLVDNHIVQPIAANNPNITPMPVKATAQEVALLRDYGKVFYYKVEIGLGNNNYTETRYITCLQSPVDYDGFLPTPNPTAIGYKLPLTDAFGATLVRYNSSSELVVDKKSLISNPQFIFHDQGFNAPTITNKQLVAFSKINNQGFVTLQFCYRNYCNLPF